MITNKRTPAKININGISLFRVHLAAIAKGLEQDKKKLVVRIENLFLCIEVKL